MARKKDTKTTQPQNLADEIKFTLPSPDGPEKLLANATIVIHTGLLAGYRLEGFALWQAEGDKGKFISVTVPSRKMGERRFYEFLRTQSGDIKDMDRIKGILVNEYRAFVERTDHQQASAAPEDHTSKDDESEKD